MYKIRVTFTELNYDFLSNLDSEEAKGAREVSCRSDTASIIVTDANNQPVAYAVFGKDKGGMIAVYYMRSFVKGLGHVLMRNFFGVSHVLGKPLRMHVQNLKDIAIKARMFGAEFATDGVDQDGILQGIFSSE